ncbi:MAG: hypothetical protein VCB07_02390, partial [Gammaproteobacteria bacterium]
MNNSSAIFRYVIAGILVLSSSTAATATQNDVMPALDNFGSMRKNDPIFLARGANESFILSEPATPPPEPVAPPPVKTLEAIVITPLPDDTVTFQPLPAPQDPAELLASLSGDDRETLAEISEQTGIPIEQLALELVGPDTGSTAEQPESGGAIITYPEDQITEAGQRIHYAILAASAASLLLLVGFIVQLFMFRRKSSRASVTTATLAASIDQRVGFEEEDTVIWDGEPSDADGMFGSSADVALGEDPGAAFAAARAYANSDVFDGAGNTGISKGDPGDETIGEDLATVVVTSLAEVSELPQEQDYLGATANNPIDEDEDEEDLGVEINLDAVGEAGQDEDFDAEAS